MSRLTWKVPSAFIVSKVFLFLECIDSNTLLCRIHKQVKRVRRDCVASRRCTVFGDERNRFFKGLIVSQRLGANAMKFKVTKIAAAVAAGVGVSVAGINAANADQLLFPYAAVSPTVTTILTVVNKTESGFFFASSDELHYHYYHKSGAKADNLSETCDEINFGQNTSPNDIVTFDVGGFYGDSLGVLFEDNATNENAKYSSNPTKNFSGLDQTVFGISRAFALVDNDQAFTVDSAALGNQLHGEALVIEFQSGAAWGYQAYNAASIIGTNAVGAKVQLNPFEFSDRVETKGEVLATNAGGISLGDNWVPISLMPFAEISTRFFVTPIATTYNNGPYNGGFANSSPFQFRGDLTATVGLAVSSPLDTNTIVGVMFDRDENPISGRAPKTVVCVGGIDAKTLLAQGVADRVPNGGWSNFAIANPTAAQIKADSTYRLTSQAVAIKLEFDDKAKPTLDGQPVGGIYNNGFWMTRGIRESQTRATTLFGGLTSFVASALPVFEIGYCDQPGVVNTSCTLPSGGTGNLVLERNSPYPVLPTTALPADNLSVFSLAF